MQYQTIIFSEQLSKLAMLKTLSVCQKNFSASNFFMPIFNMSVTYLQSVEKIQWKLLEELISQSMHYQALLLGAVVETRLS